MRFVHAAIIALVAAVVLPYSAAAAQISNSVDVTSARADAERQLVAMGINPGDATFQVGARNYAGPNCPGAGWSCTSASTSVLIQLGNMNFAEVRECADGTVSGGNTCTIIQGSPTSTGSNMARCFIDSGDVATAEESCVITQTTTNGDNKAEVRLTIRQKGGSTEDATQMATVMQTTSGSGSNSSKVEETVDQDSHDDASAQSQDAHQRADVTQMSDSGRNFSQVRQSQKQSLHSNSMNAMQDQNVTCTGFAFGYNAWASVDQISTTGANESNLDQSIDQDEHATKADAGSQQQGFSIFCGGLGGHVDQGSTGKSRTTNHQSERQTQKINKDSGVSQDQFGPVFCCSMQGTNTGDRFDIDQSSDQNSNGMITTQETSLEGDYTTTGDGKLMQRATNNDDRQTNQCSGPSCHEFITCLDEEGGSVCAPEPPPD